MADMIISKSKTKESVKECNVSGEFYTALDKKVRKIQKKNMAAAKQRKRGLRKPLAILDVSMIPIALP